MAVSSSALTQVTEASCIATSSLEPALGLRKARGVAANAVPPALKIVTAVARSGVPERIRHAAQGDGQIRGDAEPCLEHGLTARVVVDDDVEAARGLPGGHGRLDAIGGARDQSGVELGLRRRFARPAPG